MYQPPKPANDNWRPPPTPANQNYKPPVYKPGFSDVKRAAKLVPQVRAALIAAQAIHYAYQNAYNGIVPGTFLPPGGVYRLNCGSGTIIIGRASTTCNTLAGYETWGDNINVPQITSGIYYDWNVVTSTMVAPDGYGQVKQQIRQTIATAPNARIMINPAVSPFFTPYNAPAYMPELDPFALPINSPVPAPRPLPRTAPRPNRSPGRSPQESTVRGPRLRNPPVRNPYYEVSKGPVKVTATTTHSRKPPTKGEKEKKWSEGVAGSWPSWALNQATEADDVVDALWEAIPEHLRTGGNCSRSLICKAKDIYKNLNSLDLGLAAYNLAANAVEDAIAGRAIGKLQAAAIKAGLNPGAINPGGKL